MQYKITHTTKYNYSDPVPVCHNLVHLSPRELPHQKLQSFTLLINPVPSNRTRRVDYFGNQVDYFSVHEAHLGLIVTASSQLEVTKRVTPEDAVSTPWEAVVALTRNAKKKAHINAYQYTFSSRYVPLGKSFVDYARKSFPAERPLLAACVALTEQVYRDFAYDPRATTLSTPVAEVLEKRAGVCQDFAHLQIACLRSLGIPARYVSGYLRTMPPPGQPRLVGADASHAWLSVYCGEPLGWVDFDPTNNVIPGEDHITVAWGRDYHDVCPVQGVFIGGGHRSLAISVDVEPLTNAPSRAAR